jgi:hypothetical protein
VDTLQSIDIEAFLMAAVSSSIERLQKKLEKDPEFTGIPAARRGAGEGRPSG